MSIPRSPSQAHTSCVPQQNAVAYDKSQSTSVRMMLITIDVVMGK